MHRSFEKMKMQNVLDYVKITERDLQSLQQDLESARQQIDVLWNEIQNLENDRKKYILQKLNDTDWKNLNLYSGTSEFSKKYYFDYVNMLRNHLTGRGYALYDKPDNECARLVFQGDYFINQVFVFYGISKTKVIGKSFINMYKEGEAHQAKEALQTDEFKKYSDSISALVKKLDIPQDVIGEINSEQWKYEDGKILPELSEMAQNFFYDVISKLDIYKNSLKHCLEREFDKNDQLKIKDNERIDLKNEVVGKLEGQIRFETSPDNKNSFRNKLKFNFVEFLKRDDCIKYVLDYANNVMSDEDKKALETLCSFKYWHPNRQKPNYYGSLLTWYTCDSVFFRSLSNGDKEKVLDTLRSFWDGFLKDQDKDVKNNKQLNCTKLDNAENRTELKKDFVGNNPKYLQNIKLNPNQNQDMKNNRDKFDNNENEQKREQKISQDFLNEIFNGNNDKNLSQKQSDPLNVVAHEAGKSKKSTWEKSNTDINKTKKLKAKDKKDENDKHNKNSTDTKCSNQEIQIIKQSVNDNLENSNFKPSLPQSVIVTSNRKLCKVNIKQFSKTKYVLIKWYNNLLRWLQNLWYRITGKNKMWVYTQQDGKTENLKLSLLEDKNSISSLLNECQDKSKKTSVVARSSGNNIETK